MIHKHNFVTITQEGTDRQHGFFTAIACCELGCGEVRRVFHDGDVVVDREGLPDREEEIRLTPKDFETGLE